MGDNVVEPVQAWGPGQPVTNRSSLFDIGAVASYASQDSAYEQIVALLATRKCVTVGDLDSWTQGEISAMIRGPNLKLAKPHAAPAHPHAACTHARSRAQPELQPPCSHLVIQSLVQRRFNPHPLLSSQREAESS